MNKIDYKIHPILADIENGSLDNLKMACSNDEKGFSVCYNLLKDIWPHASQKIRQNVCYPCKTYLNAINMSATSFDKLIEQEVYEGNRPHADHWVDSQVVKPLTDIEKKREAAMKRLLGSSYGAYFMNEGLIIYCYNFDEDFNKSYTFVIEVIGDKLTTAFVQKGEDYAYMCSNHPKVIERNIKAFGLELARHTQWLVSNMQHIADMLILFERYAKIETRIIQPKTKARIEQSQLFATHNDTRLKVNIRDSRYFTTAIRNEDFLVRSHLRLQPKKVNGEWTRELIFIDSFVKHGYHRVATIEKKQAI